MKNTTIILEIFKKLTIQAIANDDELFDYLVLKGGSLLTDVLKLTERGSKDLDFSVTRKPTDFEQFKQKLQKVLEKEYKFFDFKMHEKPKEISEDMKDFWGGAEAEFKIVTKQVWEDARIDKKGKQLSPEAHRQALSRGIEKCEIDLSYHEYLDKIEETIYEGVKIKVYSLELVVAEKLRAICQQTPEYRQVIKGMDKTKGRFRDFYDIYTICENPINPISPTKAQSTDFKELVQKVFAAKKVDFALWQVVEAQKEMHREKYGELKDTLPTQEKAELQPFDFYWNYVRDTFQHLFTNP